MNPNPNPIPNPSPISNPNPNPDPNPIFMVIPSQVNAASIMARVVQEGIPLVRVRVRVVSGLGLGLQLGGGLLPKTSHSIFYIRVGQIAIFSHCQPLEREDT